MSSLFFFFSLLFSQAALAFAGHELRLRWDNFQGVQR